MTWFQSELLMFLKCSLLVILYNCVSVCNNSSVRVLTFMFNSMSIITVKCYLSILMRVLSIKATISTLSWSL